MEQQNDTLSLLTRNVDNVQRIFYLPISDSATLPHQKQETKSCRGRGGVVYCALSTISVVEQVMIVS